MSDNNQLDTTQNIPLGNMLITVPIDQHEQYRTNIITYFCITVNHNLLTLDADSKIQFFELAEKNINIFNSVPHKGIPLFDYIIHNDEHYTLREFYGDENAHQWRPCPLVKQYNIWKDTGTIQVADDHTPINDHDIDDYNALTPEGIENYNRDIAHYLRFQICNDFSNLDPAELENAFKLILDHSKLLETILGAGIPLVDYELYGDAFKTINETIPSTDEDVQLSLPLVQEYIEWKSKQPQ